MTNLLIIRDFLKAFFQRYERFLVPVVRFLYAMMVLIVFRNLFGYSDTLYEMPVVLAISFVCAFVPTGVIYIMMAIIAVMDVMNLSTQVALVLVIFFLVIYLLYLRFVPGKSWMVLVSMMLAIKLPCLVPLLAAMFVGPVAIVPAISGIVLYYFSIHARQLEPLINASTDDVSESQIPYLMTTLVGDKEMLLFIAVTAIIIMITYLIYKSSLRHAWFMAIVIGTALMIFMLLAGSMMIEDDISVFTILLGSLLSGAIAIVVQFFKGVLDYGRIEIVQFEDDEYYYYVKAIPKIHIAEKDVNVQKFNERDANSDDYE
ncbi:MAG: hypothetical protein K5656_11955 [Lachnospiraceae bacterium]|nr:hypothetical protein [Lachnospiraceae bacterium]